MQLAEVPDQISSKGMGAGMLLESGALTLSRDLLEEDRTMTCGTINRLHDPRAQYQLSNSKHFPAHDCIYSKRSRQWRQGRKLFQRSETGWVGAD